MSYAFPQVLGGREEGPPYLAWEIVVHLVEHRACAAQSLDLVLDVPVKLVRLVLILAPQANHLDPITPPPTLLPLHAPDSLHSPVAADF